MLVCAALLFPVANCAAAQNYVWQIESSMTCETGAYGSEERTDIFYWPVILKRFFSRGDVALTVPYLSLDTEGETTLVDGTPVEGNGGGGSGLGDISIKGRYNWLEQKGKQPFVDLTARLKLPTADEGDGLGTGEFDLGFGAEFVRNMGNNYVGFADLTYTFIGDPDGISYDNRIDADFGLGYQFRRELMGIALYNYRSAISSSGSDAHSLLFLGNCRVSPQIRTYAMLELGLSSGAADYGLTFGASYRF